MPGYPAGHVITADEYNPVICELRQTAAQSIPNSSTTTPVTFDTEDIDTDSGHSTSSNTSRYTAQRAARFQISGKVNFATNATGQRSAWWSINGTQLAASQVDVPGNASVGPCLVLPTMTVLLAVGDYVEMIAFQNSGGSLNTASSSTAGLTALQARMSVSSRGIQ